MVAEYDFAAVEQTTSAPGSRRSALVKTCQGLPHIRAPGAQATALINVTRRSTRYRRYINERSLARPTARSPDYVQKIHEMPVPTA
jgi:hypothetical protein